MTIPERTGKHQTSDYIAAFCQYAGCEENEIQIKRLDGHGVVLYNNETFMVSHYDDLVDDYRSYFERESYDEIYTQTHEGIFAQMLIDEVELTPNELITGIYRKWYVYWNKQKEKISREEHYQTLRRESWEQLLILIETIKVNHLEVVKNGDALDLIFIPMIALVIRDQYEDPEDFYQVAIDILVENGANWLTMGDTFEEIFLGDDDDDVDDDTQGPFYIYNPTIEFEDLEKELS